MSTSAVEKLSGWIKSLKGGVKLNALSYVNCVLSPFIFILLCMIPGVEKLYKSQIDCLSGSDASLQAAINSFCLVEGKFTVTREGREEEFMVNRHSYYIWVNYIMLICALKTMMGPVVYKFVLFGDILDTFINNLKAGSKIDSNASKEDSKIFLNNLFTLKRINADSWFWSQSFLALEIVNTIIPIAQGYFLNFCMGGKFLSLGLHMTNQHELDTIFPKTAKCVFHRYGPSGSIENHDSLCILSNNILHEKIFLCAWLWLLILIVLQFVGLVWRICTFLFFKTEWFYPFVWSHDGVSGSVRYKKFQRTILNQLTFRQWLYMYYIFKNMDLQMFEVLIENLENNFSCDCRNEEQSLLTTNDNNLNSSETVLDEDISNDFLEDIECQTLLNILLILLQETAQSFSHSKNVEKISQQMNASGSFKIQFSPTDSLVKKSVDIKWVPLYRETCNQQEGADNKQNFNCKISINDGFSFVICVNPNLTPALCNSSEAVTCENITVSEIISDTNSTSVSNSGIIPPEATPEAEHSNNQQFNAESSVSSSSTNRIHTKCVTKCKPEGIKMDRYNGSSSTSTRSALSSPSSNDETSSESLLINLRATKPNPAVVYRKNKDLVHNNSEVD